MEEMWTIVLTASFTLVGGVILFVTGEFIRTLVVVPLQKYQEHVETILDRLDFYANFYTRVFSDNLTSDELAEIRIYRSHMRSAASQLKAKYSLMGWKQFLIWRRTIPDQETINKAYKALIYLSNSVLYEDQLNAHNKPELNAERASEARTYLTSH